MVAGDVGVVVNDRSQLLKGCLHKSSIIDWVLEVILRNVVGVPDDEGDSLLGVGDT